jgi:hypothetical protein
MVNSMPESRGVLVGKLAGLVFGRGFGSAEN